MSVTETIVAIVQSFVAVILVSLVLAFYLVVIGGFLLLGLWVLGGIGPKESEDGYET